MSTAPTFQWLEVEEIDGTFVVRLRPRVLLEDWLVRAVGQELIRLADYFGPQNYILTFRNTRRLSSALLAKLVLFRKKVHGLGGRVVVSNLPPELAEIFQVTALHQLFPIYDNELEALEVP